MKIVFKEVTIKNFLSFGNVPTTFNYESGINIVTGRNLDNGTRNGVGKSSLLVDAISFAIYGKPLRGEHVNKDEVVNEINKKGCEVSVSFSIGSDEYLVKRTAKPTTFAVYLNGTDDEHEYKMDSIKQTEWWLIDRIGISHTCFKNIIVLNMNDSTPFLNMDATKKREVIEDVLSMNVYGRMAEIAKDKHLIAKSDLKTSETKLNSNREKLELAMNSHANLQREKEKFDTEKAANIDALNKQIINISVKKGELESKIDQTDFDGELKIKKERLEQVRGIITQANTRIAIITNDIKENTDAVEYLKEKPHCPKCNTPTNNPIIQNFIQEKNDKIANLSKEKKELSDKVRKANTKFDALTTEINDFEDKRDAQKDLQNQINIEASNLASKIESLKNEESRVFNVENIISDKELEEFKKKLEESTIEVAETTKSHNFNLVLRKILGEDGVRKFVLSRILPFFNNKINQYLKIMGSELILKFNSSLDEQIFTRTREERTYGSFSAGEKKRIDIAILLSLMDLAKLQNSVDTNILILDEVLDTAMDNEGIENFLNYLKDGFRIMYPDKAVYIITHRNTISDDFYNRMIILQKKDGFTTIDSIVEMNAPKDK
jgi:DNA repair exonuclease SbcCD ATPase subunit